MIRIQTEPFSSEAELARLIQDRPDIGAVVTFLGLVREFTDSAPVTALILEHYPGMTELELEKIAQEARERFSLEALHVVHRVGTLAVGEPIVLVMAAAGHRADAFLACRFVIDHLKRRATFWKKERLSSGEERWVHNCPGCEEAARQWESAQHATSSTPLSEPPRHAVDWTGLRVGILTLSDSRNLTTDQSGAMLEGLVLGYGATVAHRAILPDDQPSIQACLVRWADDDKLDLVLTTGGTGPAPRDVTPEATRAVCGQELPGLAEWMRAAGVAQTRTALLSRGITAVRGATLVVNLPGSTRGARHSLEVVADLLPHALRMVHGGGHHAP
ncbi:MAG: molybdenum cofactor biosynthesis protein MoaE [Magnetococcus sp. MYC-9]